MADERYAWLDRDAAERILRGEPVEAADERAGAQAERLSDALRGVAGVTYANGAELPGEAAALAGFRQAAAARGMDTTAAGRTAAGGAASSGATGDLAGTVRLAVLTRTGPVPRLSRPVRRGLVAVVAGCALGLMAVAVNAAAILPAPFAVEHTPLPADPAPATKTPVPRASTPAEPDSGPSRPTGVPGGPGTGPSGTPSSVGPARDADKDTDARDSGGEATGEPALPGGVHGYDWPHRYQQSLDDCRDRRSGAITPERREALESAARGAQWVGRYCDRLLSADHGGTGGKQGRGGGRGGAGGDGGGDDGNNHTDHADDGSTGNPEDGDGDGGVPASPYASGPPTAPWSPDTSGQPTPTHTPTMSPEPLN